jgi:hypothetical protein
MRELCPDICNLPFLVVLPTGCEGPYTMKPIEQSVIQRFANAFCYGRTGFSLEQIPAFFAAYQGSVPDVAGYAVAPAKSSIFEDCVRALTPENQRMALYDLCDNPPPAKHQMPGAPKRLELLTLLVQADGRAPLGVELSSMTLSGIRRQWMTAASRLPSSPAGAITAGRALLESTCKTILTELGETPDSTGDLGKLYKQVRIKLGIEAKHGPSQSVHQMLSGLTQVVDGIAGLSNVAGDRHGLAEGLKITDLAFASLAVHAAGSVCVFLVRVHKDLLRGPS